VTPSAGAPPRLLGGAFAAVFASSLVFFTGGGVILPVAPRFAEGPIGADAIGFGIAIGIWSFASLAVRPLVGWSADRYGRRPLLVIGALLTVFALALHLAATSLPLFIGARAVLGVAEAAFLVAALAAAGDLAPPGRTGEAISLVSLSLYIGLVVGPVLGEAVLGAAGYAGVWIVAGALSVVAAGLAWLVPETRPSAPPADAIDNAGTRRRGRLLHPAGLLPGVIIMCGLWGMAAFLTFLPLHAAALGLSGAGPALAVFGAVVIAVRLFGAKLPDRVGAVPLTATALGFTAIGSVLIALVGGLPGLLLGSAILGVGVAMTMPAVLTLAISRAPASERGAVVGTASLFLDLAFGLAPVFLAPIAARAGYPAIFLASSVVAVLGALILLATRSRLVVAPQPAG
jgi:MFS family permease